MRGKEKYLAGDDRNLGITPAYAGKRHFGHGQTTASSGSPPPMRGKVRQIRHLLFQIRITPAYAGKSLFRRMGHNQRRDHPRLCGEKGFAVSHSVIFTGSPPPMRGKAAVGILFPAS